MFNLRITLSRYDGVMLRSEKIKHFVKIFVVLKCKKKTDFKLFDEDIHFFSGFRPDRLQFEGV